MNICFVLSFVLNLTCWFCYCLCCLLLLGVMNDYVVTFVSLCLPCVIFVSVFSFQFGAALALVVTDICLTGIALMVIALVKLEVA